jgi:small subunit ribosomal protein S12e
MHVVPILFLLIIFSFILIREENAPVEVAAPVAAPTPVLGEPMDLMTALQLVMKKSSAHDGLVKGLREAAKAIEKHSAQICVLAEDCDQPDYVKLVKALCAEHNVHLVTVPSAKTLGEWAGVSTYYLHLNQSLSSYSSALNWFWLHLHKISYLSDNTYLLWR